jgi:hypothetical protein
MGCAVVSYGRLSSVKTASNDASSLVGERFALGSETADAQSNAASSYLSALSSVFGDIPSPSGVISYNFPSINVLSIQKPAAPNVSIDTGNAPVKGDLIVITIPTITIPNYDIIEPSVTELEYDEPIYQSDIQNALTTALIDFVENGGTGINAEIENAIIERSRDRQAVLNQRVYDKANGFMLSRGYILPHCVLTNLLTEALTEEIKANTQLENEISIEQARLSRDQSNFSISSSVVLEGQKKKHFNAVANRALDCAKAAVQVIIDLYIAKIEAYVIKIEAEKIKVEAEKVKVDAAVAYNKSVVSIYSADIKGYEAKLKAEIGIVEALAKVYGFEVMGYEADAKIATLDLEAQIKEYQGRIDQAKNEAALTLKEAELAIQSYLGAFQVDASVAKAECNISSQWLASALSMANANASMGDNVLRAGACTEQATDTKSYSNSCSEIHTYHHD